jgi:hypothetical protein
MGDEIFIISNSSVLRKALKTVVTGYFCIYCPCSLYVIHKEGLSPSEEINRLVIFCFTISIALNKQFFRRIPPGFLFGSLIARTYTHRTSTMGDSSFTCVRRGVVNIELPVGILTMRVQGEQCDEARDLQ